MRRARSGRHAHQRRRGLAFRSGEVLAAFAAGSYPCRRGAEVLDILTAWGTGDPGGIGTIHANTAIGALRRLEQLVQEVVISVPRALIADTIDLIAVLSGRGSSLRQQLNAVFLYDRKELERGSNRPLRADFPFLNRRFARVQIARENRIETIVALPRRYKMEQFFLL